MKIALLGDIAFFGKFSISNNSSLKNYFKQASELLSMYDLVVGNLETPFVQNSKPYGYKSAYIKSNPENIELLKFLNVGMVNLSNNHMYDFGSRGYDLTIKQLKENNIKYFGIEEQQLIYEFQENRIAFNGYCCYSTNPLGIHTRRQKGINELNYDHVLGHLEKNVEKDLFNIMSFHIGQEHVNLPNYDHIKFGRSLAERGHPFLFYGHHPHVAQGVEKVKGSLLAYSLGNFCFDDVYTPKSKEPLVKQSKNNKESFILEVILEDNLIKSHKIIPIYMADHEMEIGNEEIRKKIDDYSSDLKLPIEEFNKKRTTILNQYISSRKKRRDLKWYLKRLNHRSFFQILSSRSNAKKYHERFKSKL